MSARQASVESYAHKAAKATIVGWLRDVAVVDEWVSAAGIRWRVNRDAPYYGVWEEYPIVDGEDCSVWDESGWQYDLESLRTHKSIALGRALRNGGRRTLQGFRQPFGWMQERFFGHDWQDGERDALPWMQARQPIPTYAELVELGTPPKLILDIAVQHKGCISAGIEVVHKHDLTDRKRLLLEKLIGPTYVVSAEWVLSQVDVPTRLVVLEVVNDNPNQPAFDVMRAGRRVQA